LPWLLPPQLLSAQPRYDMQQLLRERLNRGVTAVRDGEGQVCVTWRTLSTDGRGEAFDVYRNGVKLNRQPLTAGGTFFIDRQPLNGEKVVYEVRGGGMNGNCTLDADSPVGYIPITLDKPQGGTTPDGRRYDYTANDASIGDVDGDGQYELFLKWEPTNAHDNAHPGYTGNVLIDCYSIGNGSGGDGRKLWRIDLGRNIRAGAHYTQFMVYDFDGDGRAEMMCKTADGTQDGTGGVIGDGTKDWRTGAPTSLEPTRDENKSEGRILQGPEYLTVFDGMTGRALATVDYVPERGELKAWGDGYANRSDRFLAAVAYLDGRRASAIFCRGYYTRTVIAAWDWDGSRLTSRWVFDTNQPQWAAYAGQGNHNLRVCDVDGDGCDEITYGSMCVDNDGSGLYNTGFGHGDAIHLVPEPDGSLYIWDCHENKRDGVDLRHAATGRVVFRNPSPTDVGRCMAADIDPEHPGTELWSSADECIYNIKGEVVHERLGGRRSINFGIWWDGDLLRELLDHEQVLKYDAARKEIRRLFRFDGCKFNNWTKSTPCLQADILGDWREEVVTRTADSRELRIYVSTIPTEYRINCLEEDMPYRLSVAAQNVAYNQPPEPGYYIGPERTDYLRNKE
jgi:rhamnogalacturonan endolyase